MIYSKTTLLLFLFSLLTSQCSNQNLSSERDEYNTEISNWRAMRIERLKCKTGWLNLAGLYWLKEGENTFGSDSSNNIIFPANSRAFYGSIYKSGDTIRFKSTKDTDVRVDNIIVKEMLVVSDELGKPSLMECDNFAWYIIKREQGYGIRLRDYTHPRISKLKHIPCYKTSPEWKILVEYIPFDTIRKIETVTVTGRKQINDCPGELFFTKDNKDYHLLPISEGSELFIIFADKTNGIETYGNGRFLYASLPDSSNNVILDFNKACNPPCAFTPFATCPMPPRENFLDMSVEAGEKEVHL